MRWNVSVAALSASWGLVAVIVAGVDLDATALVFLRLGFAAAAIGIGLVAARRFDLIRLPRLRMRTALVGIGLGAHWLLFFLTIKLSSVAVAVLTVYAAPVFLAALAPVLLPEARSRLALVALVPATAGLVLIALGGEGGDDAAIRPVALATGLGAALTYALLVIGTKHLSERLPAPSIAFWYYATAAVAVTPLLLTADAVVPRGVDLLYVALLGVVFTGAAGIAYVWLLRKVTAQTVGVLGYLEPVSAALLAWALLGERLTAAVVVGGALVVAAGLLVVLFEPIEAPAAEAVPVAGGAVGRGQ